MVMRWLLGAPLRYLAAFVLLGGGWHLAALSFGPDVLPDPAVTFSAFAAALSDETFLSHMTASFVRLLAGLAVAGLFALPLGLLLGHCPKADWIGAPLLFITYPLPKIVLLPVFFLMLGIEDASRIALIALTCGTQMMVIIRQSARDLEPVFADAVSFMGGSVSDRIRHVYLPAVVPSFLTGLKVATGTAVAVLFLAESFATDKGLGYLIMDAWGLGDTVSMFVAILGMSLLGLVFYGAVWVAERVFCSWARV